MCLSVNASFHIVKQTMQSQSEAQHYFTLQWHCEHLSLRWFRMKASHRIDARSGPSRQLKPTTWLRSSKNMAGTAQTRVPEVSRVHRVNAFAWTWFALIDRR